MLAPASKLISKPSGPWPAVPIERSRILTHSYEHHIVIISPIPTALSTFSLSPLYAYSKLQLSYDAIQ